MVTLIQSNQLFIVIVHYTGASAEQQHLISTLNPGVDIFAKQPGFISLTMHRSLDGTQIMVYLPWRSQADHEVCMTNPEFFTVGQEMMAYPLQK